MATEHVAVLFTDVVGSTELSMSASPEEADEVRRTHFAVLRQAIAETDGTEVKNLGDGLMVIFGSASAALACAAAMQQGVELENRGRAHPVGLRVGVSGGEAAQEDGDYFGDPVVEAARLCGACERGQILAADVVRLMAGRRNRQECRPVGPLTLKGLAHPLDAVEVTWEPLSSAAAEAIPLPERLRVRPDVGVVGRSPDLELVGDAVKRTANQPRREVILISGEAGVGKTTLVAEAARAAFDVGACVLFGHCEEDLVAPYQLFAEALGHYVTHAPEDRLVAHVDAHGSELERLVPALASRIPDLPPTKATDADSERYLLYAAVIGLLVDASADQPIVFVLDDVQWADRGSLLLLRHLCATEQPMRVLVLGTFRDRELSTSHPLLETLAALHRQRDISRIELTGLDDAGVLAFMEAAAGYALEGTAVDLARALHRETDGNPFFVAEVLRHLSETRAIYQDRSGRWVTDGPLDQMVLPDTIREVIGARIGRLGAEAGRVLEVAAVIGRDFDLDLLARSTGSSEDDLLDILDRATAASLVREVSNEAGRYNFAHALVQHVVYQSLGPTRRARKHRLVAEALESMCGDRPGSRIGELARHWCNAQPLDPDRAIRYARAAGDAALAALAPEDARQCYAQALEIAAEHPMPDATLELDLTIGLGTAQRQIGDAASRATLLDAAQRAAELDDTERLVTAALANDRGFFSEGGDVDADKVALLELALERLPDDHPHRALVLGNLCAELAFSRTLDHRQALADEALTIAEAAGDDATTVRILNHLVFPLFVPSRLDQSLAWSADALTRAERVGDPVLLYSAAMYRSTVATRAGDIDELDRCLAIAGPLTRQLNQPVLEWEHTFHLARRAQIAGKPDEAERLATEALTIGTDCGQPDAATFYGVQLAAITWQRGTLGDLAPLIEQMAAESPGLPTLKASLAVAYAEDDRFDDARRVLDEFATAGYDLPHDAAWLNGMTEYAEAAIACDDPTYAEPLHDRLEPFADLFSSAGGFTAEGPVCLVLGGLCAVLGRLDEAERHFAASAAFCERFEARYFAARTDLGWGRMLLRHDGSAEHERARELLTRARSVAASNGYGGIERRAASALATVPAGPPRNRRREDQRLPR